MELTNPDLHSFCYTSLAQLLVDMESAFGTGHDVVCISGVSIDVFETIEQARDEGKSWFHKARLAYITSGLLLFVTMPGLRRDVAQTGIGYQLQRLGVQMGLTKNLPGGGSGKHTVHKNSSAEPDGCFYATGWANGPTVVIEVASSQSFNNVKAKGALWITSPGIKAVVLVNLDAASRTITVTKLVPAPQAHHTRGSPSPHPETAACVVIRPVHGAPGAYPLDPSLDQTLALAYGDVTGEAAPAGGPRDFCLDAAFLREWAADVWSV